MKKHKTLHDLVKGEILKRINLNEYKPGDKIPTELELCEEFNVSRTTVRNALMQLTLEGRLIRKQGKGTFVAKSKISQTLSYTLKQYKEQVSMQGKLPKIKLIDIEVVPANELLHKKLDVELNAPIQKIERVRTADDSPLQYEISFIPWDVAPGITVHDAETSLFVSLNKKHGVKVAKTKEELEIVLMDKTVSKFLQCEIGTPCFYINTITTDKNGNKIEFSQSYFRSDKTNFIIERNYPTD